MRQPPENRLKIEEIEVLAGGANNEKEAAEAAARTRRAAGCKALSRRRAS